ncbi:MAG: prepilin-type N-terminal cleavage/methylation domain-containing protein [Candidatus Saccharicenans sp.]|jgi:prepilin-type N-terminal cleavage/methylation domain-containing protein|nr:prepilin-type N-terminal cleavage/methylation domain-containing protein [Candidatus Saccharicenans sp.]MDH7574441.1 prepilin-type N-terminal cleavage/methylation domain-containing protein [Candidatus Saccharicenans sp.]
MIKKQRDKMIGRKKETARGQEGFTLIEVIISLALVTVVFVSLAQLFTLSVMQNLRSNEMSNAIFLAQQQIDYLRTLTIDELGNFPTVNIGESNDELIDINQDGTEDFRRLTVVTPSQVANTAGFDVLVMVFPIFARNVARDQLIANPDKYRVRAYVHTIITR